MIRRALALLVTVIASLVLSVTLPLGVMAAQAHGGLDAGLLDVFRIHYLSSAVPHGTNSGTYAEDCLAALAVASSPSNAAAVARAVNMADRLIQISDADKAGPNGWPYDPNGIDRSNCAGPGTLETFHQGNCNPRGTRYMWQTGHALLCLAKVSLLTKNPRYVKVAEAVVHTSWNMGTRPDGCKDCFYYWYSYSPNDVGHYVRNTNALMGSALAWIWDATRDPAYKERAQAIANAEEREFSKGNFGYLGVDDPKYKSEPAIQADYIENHAASVIKADYDLAVLLNDRELVPLAVNLWSKWSNCSNKRCHADGCEATGAAPSCQNSYTFTPCALSSVSADAASSCEADIQYARAYGKFPSIFAMRFIFDDVSPLK